MTSHPTVELLSTYLDDELTSRQLKQVKDHLAICEDCHERLLGLRKVARNLGALERMAPPPHLGFQLKRIAAAQRSQPTLLEKLETGASRLGPQGGTIPVVFAVVVALVLIIYLLSWGIARREQGTIPVHLHPETVATEASELVPDSVLTRQVAGRSFLYREGIWVEEGLEEAAIFREMSGDDPDAQRLFERHHELEELTTLGSPVRLRVDGVLIEIHFAGG